MRIFLTSYGRWEHLRYCFLSWKRVMRKKDFFFGRKRKVSSEIKFYFFRKGISNI
jgi:hypothetical protein